jgi:hypothetical protein
MPAETSAATTITASGKNRFLDMVSSCLTMIRPQIEEGQTRARF